MIVQNIKHLMHNVYCAAASLQVHSVQHTSDQQQWKARLVIHLLPSAMFYSTSPSHIVSHPFIFLPPLPSHSSHYSLSSTFKWENDGKRGGAGCSRVTWSTHASFNLESNFTGTHLRHHKRHP